MDKVFQQSIKYNFRTGEDYFNVWLNNKLPEKEYDLFKI